jgi:hypothetical protein
VSSRNEFEDYEEPLVKVTLLVGGQFEAGRPAGWAPGTPITVPMAINFSALPIEPGVRYVWRLAVNDTGEPEWTLPFRVRTAPPA